MGNMKKAVEWTVCPVSTNASHEVTIQSDKRIAKVNKLTGKTILSTGKGGHNGFAHLSKMLGAVEIDTPQWVTDQLAALEASEPLPTGEVVILG